MLAKHVSIELLDAHHMSYGVGTNSAKFMSLAYYAGGFPMTRKCMEDVNGGEAQGWYLFVDAFTYADGTQDRLEGSKVWRVHNNNLANAADVSAVLPRSAYREDQTDPDGKKGNPIKDLDPVTGIGLGGLVGFVSGQESSGYLPPDWGIVYPNEDGSPSRQALYVPRRYVFRDNQLPPQMFENVKQTLTEIQNKNFKAGDYVFIDSQEGKTLKEHGLMVIGYGPAILLRESWVDIRSDGFIAAVQRALESNNINVDFTSSDSHGWKIDVTNQEYVIPGVYVPYVVDWSVESGTDLRRQSPRPFYFTRYPVDAIDGGFYFEHNYWLFVPAVDYVRVRCDWYYAVNKSNDSYTPIVVDDPNASDIIVRIP